MDIEKIIKQGEGESVEFKEGFSKKVIETLISFANFRGGKIFIGVGDKWNIKWLNNITNEVIKNWINEIKNKTYNILIPDIQIIEINWKKIVLIEQNEYPIKPISLKWRYFQRKWASNHIMTTIEIADEYLKTKNTSRDMFPVDGYGTFVLNNKKIEQVIEKINNRQGFQLFENKEQFLEKYNLIDWNNPTFASLLLFSDKEEDWRSLQVGVFDKDLNIDDELDTKSFLVDQVNEIFVFIKKHIRKSMKIIWQAENVLKWEYPLPALREIILNCIIHRDYRWTHTQIRIFDDYIEFFNAGWLPDEYKIEDFISGNTMSYLRNKLIAKIFKDMWEIEKFGSWLKRITKLLEIHGCDFEIKTDRTRFYMKIYSVDYIKAPQKTPQKTTQETPQKTPQKTTQKTTQKKTKDIIIECIKLNPFITRMELKEKIWNITEDWVKYNLKVLKEKGVIMRVGPDNWGYWEIVDEI